ncbi:hypothetical protein ig2599ANME_1026 [groundwater metagenome]
MRVISIASKFSKQPEQKLITVSRIKDYSCPYRYFKNYIQNPKGDIAFQSIEAGIGQFFHSYVENHFKKVMARDTIISRTDILDVNELIAEFNLSFLWEGQLRDPYKIVNPVSTCKACPIPCKLRFQFIRVIRIRFKLILENIENHTDEYSSDIRHTFHGILSH